MRTLGAAIAIIALLSGNTVADEPAAAKGQGALSTTDAAEAGYPLKWQRRLLAAQLAFAATLSEIDPVETGSINPQAQ